MAVIDIKYDDTDEYFKNLASSRFKEPGVKLPQAQRFDECSVLYNRLSGLEFRTHVSNRVVSLGAVLKACAFSSGVSVLVASCGASESLSSSFKLNIPLAPSGLIARLKIY
ncbi:hypothetical protein RRG08_006941 [Elysia crispata]|uniref:Uncharacterized protein n=1 Tax=Elysia crispata TaxID=231223 RepID=A0AAE0YTT1_9GAST|nr:hypothetical protein RRG08_006941 [Elysia crispata]